MNSAKRRDFGGNGHNDLNLRVHGLTTSHRGAGRCCGSCADPMRISADEKFLECARCGDRAPLFPNAPAPTKGQPDE